MVITRNGRDAKLEFILGILSISLNIFGLDIEFNKSEKKYEVYYNIKIGDENYRIFVTDNMEDLMDFCNLRVLYFNYSRFNDKVIFDLLIRNKYYNSNIVTSLKSYKNIKDKFDLQETSKLFTSFHKYIREQGSPVANYIFSNYKSIYVKSIDNFFDSDVEEEISSIMKETVGHKYNKDLVTQILAHYNGRSPSEKEVEDFMYNYKKTIENFGDFFEFLLNSSKEEIISDITHYLSELKLEEYDNSI